MALTQEEFDKLSKKIGSDIAEGIQKEMQKTDTIISDKVKDVVKDRLSTEDFNKFKTEVVEELNTKLGKLEQSSIKQGDKINEMVEQYKTSVPKTIPQIIEENAEKLKEIYKAGTGYIEVDLKAAGVTTVGGTVLPMDNPPTNPFLPQAGSGELPFYEILRNPNFISNYVDMGRTDQFRLYWLNELPGQGSPAIVPEGQPKPLLDMMFKTEMSEAKKIAAMVKITEEFQQDLPALGTKVRRMLNDKVVSYFDEFLYTQVLAAAPGYTLTDLNGEMRFANRWDAMLAGLAQVSANNSASNMLALNPITNAIVIGDTKKTDMDYIRPPFSDRIERMFAESAQIAKNFVLTGDMTQYKVDIYKPFFIRMGWNNDDFGRNQFSVLGEVRFHDYISTARKAALAYFNLNTVMAQINKAA